MNEADEACACAGDCACGCGGTCGCSTKVATVYLAALHLPDALHRFAAQYEGNLGLMEMVEFYQKADPHQRKKLEGMIESGSNKDAWDYLQEVTGKKLDDVGHTNKPGNPPSYDWNGFLADKFGPNWRTEAKVPNPSTLGKILKREVLLTTALKNDKFYKGLQGEYVRWKVEKSRGKKASTSHSHHGWLWNNWLKHVAYPGKGAEANVNLPGHAAMNHSRAMHTLQYRRKMQTAFDKWKNTDGPSELKRNLGKGQEDLSQRMGPEWLREEREMSVPNAFPDPDDTSPQEDTSPQIALPHNTQNIHERQHIRDSIREIHRLVPDDHSSKEILHQLKERDSISKNQAKELLAEIEHTLKGIPIDQETPDRGQNWKNRKALAVLGRYLSYDILGQKTTDDKRWESKSTDQKISSLKGIIGSMKPDAEQTSRGPQSQYKAEFWDAQKKKIRALDNHFKAGPHGDWVKSAAESTGHSVEEIKENSHGSWGKMGSVLINNVCRNLEPSLHVTGGGFIQSTHGPKAAVAGRMRGFREEVHSELDARQEHFEREKHEQFEEQQQTHKETFGDLKKEAKSVQAVLTPLIEKYGGESGYRNRSVEAWRDSFTTVFKKLENEPEESDPIAKSNWVSEVQSEVNALGGTSYLSTGRYNYYLRSPREVVPYEKRDNPENLKKEKEWKADLEAAKKKVDAFQEKLKEKSERQLPQLPAIDDITTVGDAARTIGTYWNDLQNVTSNYTYRNYLEPILKKLYTEDSPTLSLEEYGYIDNLRRGTRGAGKLTGAKLRQRFGDDKGNTFHHAIKLLIGKADELIPMVETPDYAIKSSKHDESKGLGLKLRKDRFHRVQVSVGRSDHDGFRTFLGDDFKDMPNEDLERLVCDASGFSGVPGVKRVNINFGSHGASMNVEGRFIRNMSRGISKDSDGKIYIGNSHFRLKRSAPKGSGARQTSTQVTAARMLGASYLSCSAASGGSYNGYYTWARFGFEHHDGSGVPSERIRAWGGNSLYAAAVKDSEGNEYKGEDLYKLLKEMFGEKDSYLLSEIMMVQGPMIPFRINARRNGNRPLGAEMWKRFGSQFGARFSVEDDSNSMNVLNGYVEGSSNGNRQGWYERARGRQGSIELVTGDARYL